MKLTKEFIEQQGFKLEVVVDTVNAFTINNDDNHFQLFFDTNNNYLKLLKYVDDDNDEILFADTMPNVIQFCHLIVHYREITNGSVSFTEKMVDDFFTNNYDDYTIQEFDGMCDVVLILILAKEDYERCEPFLQFRKEQYDKHEWEYKDMPKNAFKSYADITTKI